MDSSRSNNNDENASYSEDFDQDVESQESPISEEKVEIKVFKSSVGSLTVQPKKPSITKPKTTTTRTLSEVSLYPKLKTSSVMPSDPLPSNLGSSRNIPIRKNDSVSSLVRMGIHSVQPLAHDKIDPHDVPVSGSASSVSLSRVSMQGTNSSYTRGAGGSIRRVAAHTTIKEKSYASAKFKTYNYNNPPGRNPPLKVGVAKPNGNVAQRVASAKRMTIMDLKSKIKLLQDETEKLKKENRFLNHLHHRQDNALRKWEGKDAELPKLLNQHKDEIRALQEQLKRSQQQTREYNDKLAVRDKKTFRLEAELDKLRALVHEEHLQDRHTLQQELDITRMNLAGAEKRIREYMRHVDILEKNHRHQLSAQERKLIKVNTHTYELQQVVANLKLALRNKDRMLNYIQMRSSGRSLIRAFHAEKGAEDTNALYGTSITTDLSRPFQPPPLMKSHSLDFGNSPRCKTAYLDDERELDILYANHHSDEIKKSTGQRQRKSLDNEVFRPLSIASNSFESVINPRASTPSNRSQKVEKGTKKCNSLHHESVSMKQSNAKPFKPILKNPNKGEDANANLSVRDGRQQVKKSQGKHLENTKSIDKSIKPSKQSSKRDKPRNETTEAKGVDKELVYCGSRAGFKYEGPFMRKDADFKQESTEILYSPKSDKCSGTSSQTTTSSRSEILSNINMLSARLKESCVLVPPPEEKVLANTSPFQSCDNDLVSYQQQNVLQSIPAFPNENQHSPKSQNSYMSSPRMHINSLSLPTMMGQTVPTQFQIQVPQPVQSNAIGYIQNDICNHLQTQPHLEVVNQETCSQVMDSPIHYSPRLAQSYPAFNTVSVLTDPQAIVGPTQQIQHSPPGYSVGYPYFSLTNSQEMTQQPTSVTIVQTNPIYEQQMTSPRENSSVVGGQSYFVPPKSSTFPPVGYYNSNSKASVGDCEQVFQNANQNSSSKPNQSSYNPSYYVNLGSWK